MENPAMIAAIVMAAIYAYIYFYERNKEKKEELMEQERLERIREDIKKSEENEMKDAKPETKELTYSILRKIGCNPEETEEGRIKFDYQGITFLMEAVDECLFVNLIWPWCYSFSKFDIDEFARVRQVVNDMNARGTVSVFYGITDSDDVALHVKKHFILVPQIPDTEGYLKIILDSFFKTVRTLDLEIEKCRLQECQNGTNRT